MTLYHIQDLGHKTPKSCKCTMKFDYSPVAYIYRAILDTGESYSRMYTLCSAVHGWTQFAGVPPKAERPINKRYERLEPRRDFDKANWERVLVTF